MIFYVSTQLPSNQEWAKLLWTRNGPYHIATSTSGSVKEIENWCGGRGGAKGKDNDTDDGDERTGVRVEDKADTGAVGVGSNVVTPEERPVAFVEGYGGDVKLCRYGWDEEEGEEREYDRRRRRGRVRRQERQRAETAWARKTTIQFYSHGFCIALSLSLSPLCFYLISSPETESLYIHTHVCRWGVVWTIMPLSSPIISNR